MKVLPLSCRRPDSTACIFEERLICHTKCLCREFSYEIKASCREWTSLTLSIYKDRIIRAHLWNETRTAVWYCSGQPLGPSPGSSVSVERASTGDLDIDSPRPDDTEGLPVGKPSGILFTIEFSFSCRSRRIARNSSISLRVRGLVPS